MKIFKRVLKWIVVLGIFGGGGYWAYTTFASPAEVQIQFRTVPVKTGTLTVAISASGTVEPEELVDIGAQVAGQIEEFGLDTEGKEIDYGSPVKAGCVLAKIDAALYEAEVKQYEARIQQCQAAILSTHADLKQQEAKLRLAEVNWNRAQTLFKSKAVSQADFDNTKALYETAAAALSVSNAAITQAEAELASAEAQLYRAQRNLDYCVIYSPVDGIIIDRRVNIGQTVVSSMSAPSLFLLAKDLKKMQVWVSVNEADIGRIKIGQEVEFTVDAYPMEKFVGSVGKIRLNASMSSNVVSYIVEVNTDNSDNRLLPYLTANVSFIEARRNDVLLLPGAALRFVPPEITIAEEHDKYLPDPDATVLPPALRKEGVVWIQQADSKLLLPAPVKLGIYDGVFYEVIEGLEPGATVVTGINATDTESQEATNPFLPKFPSRPKRK